MDEWGGLSLKQRLRCGLRGRLLELREKRDTCDMWGKWDSHFSPVLSASWGAHSDRPLSTDSLFYA